ncbi:MAG: hypothetical protein KDA65_01200 [Planctomycetaceae bacterium]|nr:hypothetical protein [Planctomycetaceae bacterium]
MRQSSSGPLTTILMLIPLVVVPLLAMFGLPSFSSKETTSPELQIEGLLGQPAPSSQLEGNLQAQPGANASQGQYGQSLMGTPSQFGHGGQLSNGSQGYGQNSNDPQGGVNSANNSNTLGNSRLGVGLSSGLSSDQFQQSNENNLNAQNGNSIGNGNSLSQLRNGLSPGSNSLSGNFSQGNSEQNQPGNPQVRNPFMADQQPANNAVATNSPGQASAIDPSELNLDESPESFPLNSNNQLFEQSNNQAATAGFGAEGFNNQQTGNIVQLSGNRPGQGNAVPNGTPNGAASGNQINGNTPAQATENVSGLTWQSAVSLLNQWGIDNFMLQPGAEAGQFHFSCYYTPTGNSSITVQFAAESSEPLKAVENVLQQIHQWHIQRQQASQNRPQ